MWDFSVSTTLKILHMSKIFHKNHWYQIEIIRFSFSMNSGNFITLVSSIYLWQDDLHGNIYGLGTTLKVFTELSSNKWDWLRWIKICLVEIWYFNLPLYVKRNWQLPSNLICCICFQFDGVNLWYFKLWLISYYLVATLICKSCT